VEDKQLKGKYWVFIIIFCFFMLLCLPLSAEFTYQVDFTSRYIWRGFDLNPNKQPALQPSIEYSCEGCGFSLNLWANISFNNKDFHEIDLNFTYDFNVSKHFSLNAGIIFYGWYFVDNFSFQDNTTQEIFISAGFPRFFLHPRLTVYYDFGNGDGIYVLLEGYYIHEFTRRIKTVFQASLGYNGGQWLADGVDPGFSDLNLGFNLLFKTGRLKISPFIRYTFVLLDAIGTDNHFWFGISLIYK
jgi:uncharacterized protein (TIGR02001 family)